ncbi:MAG: DNA-binding protein [Desulfobacteraceae bacterium]|nr:MAG: DNA-binding protein [Desulfobacteraceae bacterium]
MIMKKPPIEQAKVKVYQEPRMLLSVEETARRLSIAPRTIYNGIGRRAKVRFPIPVKRFGKRPLFDSRDVEAFIESLPSDDGTLDCVSSGSAEEPCLSKVSE